MTLTSFGQGLRHDTRNAHKTLYLEGKNRAMVCSSPQTGSFAKIAHRAIFYTRFWLCTRTLPRFDISAHSLHAQTNTNDTLLRGRYM
jgi:hypothetical protein